MVYGTQTQIIHFERGLSFASMSETQSIHAIQVLVEDTAFIDLQGTKAVQQEIRFPNGLLQAAGVRFAVARITQGLKDGLFLDLRRTTPLLCLLRQPIFPPSNSCFKRKRAPTRYGKEATCSALRPSRPIPHAVRRQDYRLWRPPLAFYAGRVCCLIPIMSVVYSWRRVPWVRLWHMRPSTSRTAS
jgi:hypothetical protein